MVDEFKYELYSNADLNTILNTTKAWLHSNGFKIKEEKVRQDNAYINAYIGVYFCTTEPATRRYLEIRVSQLPTNSYIVLYEKVTSFSDHMKSNLIKDEVMALVAFLQAGGILSQSQQQQQQQIIVNVVPQSLPLQMPPIDNQEAAFSQCPHCHAHVRIAGATFCEKCGQSITPIPPVTPASDEPAKFCNACGTPLPATAAFCKKCGAAVESRAQDTVPEVIFCIYCGAENAGDATICHVCKATIG